MENGKMIGIIGDGQLGRMLTMDAKRLGFEVTVQGPTPNSPARQVGAEQIIADLTDGLATKQLALLSDYLTIETEHVNSLALRELSLNGARVNPSPETLMMVQDKLAQKILLKNAGIPTAQFAPVSDRNDILEAAKMFKYPFLLKSRYGGYDGRGNAMIRNKKDIDLALKRFEGQPLYAEAFVNFEKELAILMARSTSGDIAAYPVVETIQQNNICHMVLAPAPIDYRTNDRVQELAKATMGVLKGAGVFGIEMFLTKRGKVLINEIAPRVHNSGHCTIELCKTSQFKQQILAITELPLGETDRISRTAVAVMVNILGVDQGKTKVEGLENVLKIPGVNVHIYGKEETKPQRKMGHITAIANSLEEARRNAELARNLISI